MNTIKPPNDFHAGSNTDALYLKVGNLKEDSKELVLDLSDVIYMDSFTFRFVFDTLPKYKKVIPPRDSHIIEMYNTWLDSKKGLSKNA